MHNGFSVGGVAGGGTPRRGGSGEQPRSGWSQRGGDFPPYMILTLTFYFDFLFFFIFIFLF